MSIPGSAPKQAFLHKYLVNTRFLYWYLVNRCVKPMYLGAGTEHIATFNASFSSCSFSDARWCTYVNDAIKFE
jgi:hypothetical protein